MKLKRNKVTLFFFLKKGLKNPNSDKRGSLNLVAMVKSCHTSPSGYRLDGNNYSGL